MLRAALLGLILANGLADAPVFPARLVDVDGAAIDLAQLAGSGRLFVVTMRTATCPVCVRQLARLERQRAGLELCGARFLVLAPGPPAQIRAARKLTGLEARWVEDTDLALARVLDLVLAPAELVPAILELDARGRVSWQQRGRNGEYYGDRALQEHMRCEQRET